MRFWPTVPLTVAVRYGVLALPLMAAAICSARVLTPSEALDLYLAEQGNERPACSESVFGVRIEASLPALKKHGTMTGFKRIAQPGQIAYRGLRFTGDNLVKNQIISRFIAHETDPPKQAGDVSVTPANYIFRFDKEADYNGLTAYVFFLKPRRKRAWLFRGELWLNAETAAPLRVWGDLVKSPSVFIRSFRFVQDYQMVRGCTEPLRLVLTARTRFAGTAEMTVWLRPVSEETEAAAASKALPNLTMEAKQQNEDNDRR